MKLPTDKQIIKYLIEENRKLRETIMELIEGKETVRDTAKRLQKCNCEKELEK